MQAVDEETELTETRKVLVKIHTPCTMISEFKLNARMLV
jgi:hypothetical protein